jgi:hypothetical protein
MDPLIPTAFTLNVTIDDATIVKLAAVSIGVSVIAAIIAHLVK